MAGDPATTPGSNRRSENGRAVRQRVSKHTYDDKENFNVFGGNAGENQKSPLPVGFPRKPLNDITAVLQSLEDQADEEASKHRKPFTRSQNLGRCSRNYDLTETNCRTRSENVSNKKLKGKSIAQATRMETKTMISSIRLTVSGADIQDQENQQTKVTPLSGKKVKIVTFAAESSSENAERGVITLKVGSCSNGEQSVEESSTFAERSETEEVLKNVQEVNDVATKVVIRMEGSQMEAAALPSASSMAEGSVTTRKIPLSDTDVLNENTVNSRPSMRRAPEQRKAKALSSRSSVVKFR